MASDETGTAARLRLVTTADRRAVASAPRPFEPAEEQAIRDQLARILARPDFARSGRLRDLLRFLVEETLAGRGHRLGGYRVGVVVFGRGSDFDPGNNSLVRNHAGRLRRALERYYYAEGAGDPLRIEVPKGAYRPRFSRPEGVGRGSAEPEAPPQTVADPVLALPTGPAIAVLPFVDLSRDPQEDYFAAGLTEELSLQLARFQELRVFGSHTALWIDAGEDPLPAAREVGARYLVRGSVRRWNGRVRVAAHLVDAGSGSELWAEHYERALSPENLITVQADVAAHVAARLVDVQGAVPRLLSRESRRRVTREMQAYEAVLRYYHFDATLSEAAFFDAMKSLERAAQADPEDALVLALLSAHYIEDDKMMYFTVKDSMARAWKLARRAVRLEPDLQRARFVLAYNHMQRREFGKCREHAERTLELNPNAAFLVGTTGWMLTLAGDSERGLPVLAKGIALNPRHPGWFHMAPCVHHLRRGELEPALAAAEAMNLPDFPWDPAVRASILARLGRRDEAREALSELLALASDFARHARHYLSGYILQNEVLEGVVEGLEVAGLEAEA